MASEGKTVSIVALNGNNYATWKIQCRMALIREGVWGIVSETEAAPDGTNAERLAKYNSRRDRALATIVLAIDPSLLYTCLETRKILQQCGKSSALNSRRRRGQIS